MNEQLELFDGIEKQITKITKKRKQRKDNKMPQAEYDLLEFKRVINQRPPKNFLRKNPNYGNDYIPLQILEMMLRSLYISYEPVITKLPMVVEGNIIFFVDVIVKNPVTKAKERFTGTSAVPIMPKNGRITDIHPHIPAGVSFAIMNACKHIGRLFRADNDDCTKIFDTYFQDKQKKDPEAEAKANMKARLLVMIKVSKTVASLEKKKKRVEELNDAHVIEMHNKKLAELIKKKK